MTRIIIILLFWGCILTSAATPKTLFRLHHISDTLLVEIPRSLLNRDLLLGARVEQVSSTHTKVKLYAGSRLYNPIRVQLRLEGDQLLMLAPDDKEIHTDTLHSNYSVFLKNHATKILHLWKSVVITDTTIIANWTSFLKNPIPKVDPFVGKTAPGRILPEMNKIVRAYCGYIHLEASIQYGFQWHNGLFSTIVRKSLQLLPDPPMTPRLYDNRIGFDHLDKRVYNLSDSIVTRKSFITRFRIQPTEKDLNSFYSGKKVKPKQPIIFYIDDAMPKIWKRAVRQGILDWNTAFERIGFKDVLQTKTFSEGGKDFDPFSSQVNCIHYVISKFPNAMGKHWTDPRTGEILQADVLLHSEVIRLLQKWYFLQTAAYRPSARRKKLRKSELQRIIRYAVAHEIGHCLGLEHNFKASSAYPTDSLRIPHFTERYGTTPSIMDYARFNYIAQPGDKVHSVYPPLLGEYDCHAIKIGYSYLPVAADSIINSWLNRTSNIPRLAYKKMNPSPIASDPSVQTDDLGNNPINSARYGINNLKTIMSKINDWNPRHNDDPFKDMPASYEDVLDAYFDYINMTIPYIGGTIGEKDYVSRELSEQVLDFVLDELTSDYLFLCSNTLKVNEKIHRKLIDKKLKKCFQKLFEPILLKHIVETSEHTGYYLNHFLRTISNRVFETDSPTEDMRINLQQTYWNLLKKREQESVKGEQLINSFIREEIKYIKQQSHYKQIQKIHLNRINNE